MRYVKMIALLVFFYLFMLFFAQNMQALSATVYLGFAQMDQTLLSVEIPVYQLLLGAIVLGGLLASFFFFMEKMRLAGEARALRTKLRAAESELTSLRNLPLEDKSYSGGDSTSG